MTLQIVTEGSCWLEVAGQARRVLREGSLSLIPHGLEHCFRSAPHVKARPLFDIPIERVSERYEIMRYGGGGAITHVTYAVLRFEHATAERLLELLPPVLELDGWRDDDWLQSTLRLIAREASALRPGGETVITRLADVIVIQALRAWLDSAPQSGSGWLAGLRDPRIGRALAAIHRDPERNWTVAALAKHAGMSRSVFAARFTRLVGDPAVRYVSDWKLRLARGELSQTKASLAELSSRYGYGSEAAFCRAFKRHFGVTPGSVRSLA
jgi:AraC-like DNA-binding protein